MIIVKNKINLLFLLCLTIGLLTSFSPIKKEMFSQEELNTMQEEVKKRTQAFIVLQKQKCEKELMKKVELKVDSILMYNFKDLIQKDGEVPQAAPPKPLPPTKPKPIEPQDDSPLAPLLDKNFFEKKEISNTKSTLD